MLISIVTPFYNEEENIRHFYDALCDIAENREEDFEFLFVDDGSEDGTPFILQRLAEQDKRVRVFVLARNFGHQLALTCGMDHARGAAVITMDGDMQHPPALIPDLLAAWYDGYEVVQTVRNSTKDVGFWKQTTSSAYYRFINAISNVHVVEGGSDFRLLDRQVLKYLNLFREHARFIRGIVSDIGYRHITIPFDAPERFAGKSKFSLRKMLHFALNGIMSHSTLPLRMAMYTGLIMGIISLLLIIYVLLIKYYFVEAVPGWATLIVCILLLGGIQLVFLGIIGEYIGRIFEEVKDRPLYWLKNQFGDEDLHRQ